VRAQVGPAAQRRRALSERALALSSLNQTHDQHESRLKRSLHTSRCPTRSSTVARRASALPSERQPAHLAVLPRARPVLERAVRAHLDAIVARSARRSAGAARTSCCARLVAEPAAATGSRGRHVDIGRDVEAVERLLRLLSARVVPRGRLRSCGQEEVRARGRSSQFGALLRRRA